MVLVKLARDLKEKYGWRVLSKDSPEYSLEEVNGYKVVSIHELLWEKIQNIIKQKKRGYDAPIIISGKRRTGKSTLAKTIAYILDPDAGVEQFVAGLEDSVEKIEKAKEDSNLVFDESSLNFGSKDSMAKTQKTLLKIMDVIGQKRLTIFFILPDFFDLNRTIAVIHSLFLIVTYTDEETWTRGRFAYFGTDKKKILYEIGKKTHSYSKPEADFTGLFTDFVPPYEEEYLKLKRESLRQAINPKKEDKIRGANNKEGIAQLAIKFQELCPHIMLKDILKGFSISDKTFYLYRKSLPNQEKEKRTHYSINLSKAQQTNILNEEVEE